MTYEKLYYDGGWQPSTSGETIAVMSSATEQEVARVPRGSAEDVNRAVKAARRGFESWSRLPVEERAQWLEKLSAAMKARVPQIAEAIKRICGDPELYARLAAGAVEFACTHLSWPEQAAKLHTFYLEV